MNTTQHPELATIGDVERLNSRSGRHFFDADTMRFFKSRICRDYDLLYGRFFITTEKYDAETPRLSTLRVALDDGAIETCGEFQQFRSPGAAYDALRKAWAAGVEVRNDPYEDVTNSDSPDDFNWRCYVGELPIGVRTTRADAGGICAQLGGER